LLSKSPRFARKLGEVPPGSVEKAAFIGRIYAAACRSRQKCGYGRAAASDRELLSKALNCHMNVTLNGGKTAAPSPAARSHALRVFCATVGRKAPGGPVGTVLLHCAEGLNR
jgi:hypothetical protein